MCRKKFGYCGIIRKTSVVFNDIFEIEAVGPLILLENFPDLFWGSLWLHFLDSAAALSNLVNRSVTILNLLEKYSKNTDTEMTAFQCKALSRIPARLPVFYCKPKMLRKHTTMEHLNHPGWNFCQTVQQETPTLQSSLLHSSPAHISVHQEQQRGTLTDRSHMPAASQKLETTIELCQHGNAQTEQRSNWPPARPQ